RIIDATGSPLGVRLANAIAGGITADTLAANVQRVPVDSLEEAVAAGEQAVQQRRIQGVLVLDPRAMDQSGSVRYVGSNATSLNDMQRLERLLSREVVAWRLEGAGLSPTRAVELSELRIRVDAR